MIPLIPNRTAFAADCNIWCTSDQLLEIGAGDMIEHAILLCNFFLYKELDAYVVLGRGLPDGLVAYVLLRDSKAASSTSLTNLKMEPDGTSKDKSIPQKYLLFNPSTGETYRIQDTHIPLKEIGCVFNSENVRDVSACH
jgi:coiled-coil and C2 domain-containing protein 2A